jgi:hypothetical protein
MRQKEEPADKILANLPIPIQGIITGLRNTIDQLNLNFKRAKESITELARRIDEDRICERGKVSRLIKYILKDKILEGKITAKWIEECLPWEYKRKYFKSEQSSLSKKAKKIQEMVVDNKGRVHSKLEKTQSENLELKEALRKASKISTAEQLAESEIRITITNDKYDEIKAAMQESSNFFYIIVDNVNRILVRAEVDLKDDIIAD